MHITSHHTTVEPLTKKQVGLIALLAIPVGILAIIGVGALLTRDILRG